MPETAYIPEPRPVPFTTALSREFGPPNATDGGTFFGPVRVSTSDTPRFTVDNGTNIAFQVWGSPQIIQTIGFAWLTVEDALTTSQPVIAEFYHSVTGTPGANVGMSVDYRADTTNAERTLAARTTALFSTATTPVTSELRTSIVVAGVTTEVLRVQTNGLSLFQTQVLGSRKTGWTAATGTATRTTWATHTPQTISAVPTQAEVQNIDNSLVLVATRLKALLDDLISHGLIGS